MVYSCCFCLGGNLDTPPKKFNINYKCHITICHSTKQQIPNNETQSSPCSGCGSVGRLAVSDRRGPRFKSSQQQNLYVLLTVLNKEKEAGNGPD